MDGREEERAGSSAKISLKYWLLSLSLADLLLLQSTSPAWYRSYSNAISALVVVLQLLGKSG